MVAYFSVELSKLAGRKDVFGELVRKFNKETATKLTPTASRT